MFNLLDSDTTTEIGEHAEERPDVFGIAKQYQQPRYVRLGIAIRY